jgi:ssDNA-binding replication factor A large subunit
MPYDVKDLMDDSKHIRRFGGSGREFIKAANNIVDNAAFIGARIYNFQDPKKLPDFQFTFWNERGEVAVSSRGVIKGFFPGDGIKAFDGKKEEFVWIRL